MTTLATISTVIFNCADPHALAEFYRKATGWEITFSDDDYVYLGGGGPIQLGLQRAADHRAPSWPGPDQQAHLDLKVADVEHAVAELVAAGASRPSFQPGEGQWVVLIDPAGHPFCVAAGG